MKTILASFSVFALSVAAADAAGFEVLTPHRAVYEVKLLDAKDRSGIEGMEGRIVYELTGNACDGVSIQYRFVTRINTGNDTFVTDQQSASHESADGMEFSFSTKSFVNDQPDQNVTGSAIRQGGGISVTHAGEEPAKQQLADGLFTSSHLVAVLESAKEGQAFVSHTIFDGSGDADRVLNSATVIGKARTVDAAMEGETGADLETLFDKPAFPMTMSYFNANADSSSESLPIYEASFLLYENGVTRDLTMRYPDYELKATISELEFLDMESCG